MWAMHVLNIKHVFKSSAVIRKEMFHVENVFFFFENFHTFMWKVCFS